MNAFAYEAARDPNDALARRSRDASSSAYLAGGTNLLDDMKLGVEQPAKLIDVNALPFDKIEPVDGGGFRVGATVRNSDLAYHDGIAKAYPALSQAILNGASGQIRNMATTAGNLLQRTRCYYFRDVHSPCNKREPGSGCAAIGGFNRIHAILGTSEKCIATHPSDMDVAMVTFGAVVHAKGADGAERDIPIEQFYVAYGRDPAKETTLAPGELITHVTLPATPWFKRSVYVKARDRASYEFALASAAVALDMDGTAVRDCRIALGGVATKPWRAAKSEAALKGKAASAETFRAAAEAELADAVPREFNAFKVELCKRVIVDALTKASALQV